MTPPPSGPGPLGPIDTWCLVCDAAPGSRCPDPDRCGPRRAELADLLEDFGIRDRGAAAQAHGVLGKGQLACEPVVQFRIGTVADGDSSIFRRLAAARPGIPVPQFRIRTPLSPEQVRRSPWLTLPEPPPDTGFHAVVRESPRWVTTDVPTVARPVAVIMAHAHHRYPGPEHAPDRVRMLGRELAHLHDDAEQSAAVTLFWLGAGLMYGVPLTWTPDGRAGVSGIFETFPGELPRTVMASYRTSGLTNLWPYLGGTADPV